MLYVELFNKRCAKIIINPRDKECFRFKDCKKAEDNDKGACNDTFHWVAGEFDDNPWNEVVRLDRIYDQSNVCYVCDAKHCLHIVAYWHD